MKLEDFHLVNSIIEKIEAIRTTIKELDKWESVCVKDHKGRGIDYTSFLTPEQDEKIEALQKEYAEKLKQYFIDLDKEYIDKLDKI